MAYVDIRHSLDSLVAVAAAVAFADNIRHNRLPDTFRQVDLQCARSCYQQKWYSASDGLLHQQARTLEAGRQAQCTVFHE